MALPERSNTKRLTIFSHKGGVGKTTLTVNIAASLGAMGKRVLLVDSDPQTNLSSYLVQSEVLDDVLDHSDSDTGKTIWSAVKPVVDGSGGFRLITPAE